MTVVSIHQHPRYRNLREPLVLRSDLEPRIGWGKTKVFEFIQLGMPVAKRHKGYNLFCVSDCRRWLDDHGYGWHDDTGHTTIYGGSHG